MYTIIRYQIGKGKEKYESLKEKNVSDNCE